MGAEESVPIPAPPVDFNYMVIMLTFNDKMRVIYGTENELTLVRQAIMQNWPLGLTEEKPKLRYSWSFKFNGCPFSMGTNAFQAASARLLMCQILQTMNNAGWEMIITSDLSRLTDLTSFFFVCTQIPKQIQFPLLCVSLSSTDKFQLVNVPSDVLHIIKGVVMNVWERGIQSERPNENSYEIKMAGNPWFSDGDEGVQARILLAKITSALAQRQWILHAAANVKSTADSLFFKYDPETIPGESSECFVLSFNRTDRLRIINAPQSVIPVVRETIMSVWQVMGGVQKEGAYHGSWEFKLKGNPWWSSDNESAMARFLVCKILEALKSRGWSLQASVDISRKSQDKSIFLFSQSLPKSQPVMCLSFCETDKIWLVNAPQQITTVCRDILMAKWYNGICREESRGSNYAHKFKLNGNPWHGGPYSSEAIHIRAMLCYMIQALKSHGWKFLTSADVSARFHNPENGPSYALDVHSWWLVYEPDSQPPQPSAPSFGFSSGSAFPPPPSYDSVVKQ